MPYPHMLNLQATDPIFFKSQIFNICLPTKKKTHSPKAIEEPTSAYWTVYTGLCDLSLTACESLFASSKPQSCEFFLGSGPNKSHVSTGHLGWRGNPWKFDQEAGDWKISNLLRMHQYPSAQSAVLKVAVMVLAQHMTCCLTTFSFRSQTQIPILGRQHGSMLSTRTKRLLSSSICWLLKKVHI